MSQAKINVLIVTYKQADVIGRNIESILQQKEYGLNEIVICDDCSPDNNWEVITSYKEKYPDIIRAYRNESNLGIYGNSNQLASLCGDADLYCWLEGDDALCDGFFRAVQEFIHEQSIDLSKPLGLFCDYIIINTKGEEYIVKNDFIKKGYDPLGAYLRLQASWHASLFTKNVIKQFRPVELNKGLILAETSFDSQWFRYIKKGYYIPVTGSIYYAGIGVSVKWGLSNPQSTYYTEETIVMWEHFIKEKFIIAPKDVSWAKCRIAYSKCVQHFSVIGLMSYVINYIKGIRGYDFNLRYLLSSIYHLLLLNNR